MWEMIKNEFKFIGKNRLIALSVFAICFIPLLYSVFFLKSVWDPYGDTQNLPIAVVNKDQAVKYNGKTLQVGDDTVTKLKKNDSLGWRFVSAQKAKEGLKDRKYYTVVTIPKNFSKNAASVLDSHPKKMNLTYETNDSLNYIGEVISSVGVTTLDKSIRTAVTNAYASTMLSEVKTMGKGMKTAATGAVQLDDGLVTMTDGVKQYTIAVSQVNDGVQTLKTSVTPLSSAASQLATGSNSLTSGLSQYTAGVSSANSGAGQLAAGTSTLNSTVTSSMSALTSSSLFTTLNSTNLNKIQTEGTDIANTLNSPDTQNAFALLTSNDTQNALAKLSSLASSMSGMQSELTAVNTALTQYLTKIGANSTTSAQDAAAVLQANPNLDADSQAKLQEIVTLQKDNGTQITKVQGTMTALNTELSGVTTTVNEISPQLTKLQALQSQLPQLQKTLTEAKSLMTDITPIMSALNDPTTQATLNSLPTQITQLQTGISTLNNGAQQLYAGTTTLNNNSSTLNSGANTLSTALGQLNTQVPTLVSGVNQLADGTSTLNGKSAELVSGADKLSSGSGTLAKALKSGSDTVNGIHTSKSTAKMFADPTKLTNKKYSTVPNYGHALAPYVLSVALYVGAIVFNFAFPIRKVAMRGKSATAWFTSKVAIGAFVAIASAVIEATLIIAFGLNVDHIGTFYLTTTIFSLTSMYLVMFLAMAFDNPGRLVSMVILMLQLGGSGGTFPMEVTNSFFNAIHPYLPMTYSILGLRQAITSGLGNGIVTQSILILILIGIISLALLWLSMYLLQQKWHAMSWKDGEDHEGSSALDDNQKLQDIEK
ncbi:phage infection protein [Paucilactobacillus oligofermentans DSM 15707 = LMG 22743]|uniref:Phage infection protein n=2 Tax=Paucilactobacillus oligofermentans TaxID=293371 RepID=A0A0R1REI8_9LACO|nr:phage infection protein [Paucilactobacillus oligofermentans DSM 15707 = LMG 22743]CUS25682.1 Putative ABC transporter, YhgE homolog [Paucilactobacillus oligofermentans DSM 15707 = LMG 22743]